MRQSRNPLPAGAPFAACCARVVAVTALSMVVTCSPRPGTGDGRAPDPLAAAIGSLDGWPSVRPLRIVPPAQLFEEIDGGAELFLQYSVVALYTVELHNGQGDTLGLEIYRHADALSAFGVFGRENDQCDESLNLFEKTCVGEHALTFRQGDLYGKVLARTSRARAACPGLAAALARKLPSGPSSLPQFDAFPAEGLTAGSCRYYPANYLGLKAMGPVFTAGYNGRVTGMAFYVPRSTPGRADSLVLALKAVYEGDAVKSFALGIGGAVLHVEDPFEGHIVVRASGNVLAGFISREESPGADALLGAIVAGAR